MKLLAAIDGPFAREPLRAGWPRIPLLLLLSLPLIAAAPLHYVLRVSLGACFVLGTLLTLALVWPLRRLGKNPLSRAQSLMANGVVIALGLFSVKLLYNADFHGVPNYVDENGHFAVDAGVHIYNYMYFLRDPVIYGGFVSMYGLWRGLSGVTDLLTAINLGWWLVELFVAVVPALIAFSLLQRFRGAAWWAGAITCLFVGVVVDRYLILPLESFYLMGGFWAQVFGLVPLFLMWWVDALVRRRFMRLVWLCLLVALYRFTYGLNLVDLLIVLGCIFLIEGAGPGLHHWVRLGLVTAGFLTFCAAWDGWVLLRPIFKDWGWIVPHDLASAHRGHWLAALTCAATMVWWPKGRGAGIQRALRFPLLFLLATYELGSVVRALPQIDAYYLFKYAFHGSILAAAVLIVIAVYWIALAFERIDLWTILGLVAVLLLANGSQDQLGRGVAAFDRSFAEHAFGPPYRRSYPWVMPDVVHFMERTLAEQHKSFAGYRASHVPVLTFTNGLFDWKDATFWRSPMLREGDKGTCIFWDTGYNTHLDSLKIHTMCEKIFQQPLGTVEVCARCY